MLKLLAYKINLKIVQSHGIFHKVCLIISSISVLSPSMYNNLFHLISHGPNKFVNGIIKRKKIVICLPLILNNQINFLFSYFISYPIRLNSKSFILCSLIHQKNNIPILHNILILHI